MFFENVDQIPEIAKNTNFAIFVMSPDTPIKLKNALYLHPDPKTNKITVDMVREFTSLSNTKQTKDQYFIVSPADAMNEAAENAFLKNLEEPNEHDVFILVTKNLSALLPTIISRAQVYVLKTKDTLSSKIDVTEDIKTLAKQLIVAKNRELPKLAVQISGKKDRNYALEVVGTAVDMLYKTFFLTGDTKFLPRLEKLITLYENIKANGHIKLHIVADLC